MKCPENVVPFRYVLRLIQTLARPIQRSAVFLIRAALVLLLSATLTRGGSPPLLNTSGPAHSPHRQNRILIQLKPNVNLDQVEGFHRKRGARVLHHFRTAGNIQVVEIPTTTSVRSHINAYLASGWVEVAEPDFWIHTTATPNDPLYTNGDQWHLNNTGQQGGLPGADIHAADAWETLSSASNVIVAVIDTGILASHPDLAANLWTNPDEIPGNGIDDDGDGIIDDVHGINAAADSGDIQDMVGHGTAVSGFIGAVGNNGIGVTGVAWQVQLMTCRFFDDEGNGSLSDVIQCFDYARTHGAKVINASFATTNFSSTLLTTLVNCRNAGIVVVAGVGNEGLNNDILPVYPASYNLDNIIAVAATDRQDELASFSNFGATNVDLAVPGQNVTSTRASSVNPYSANNGTSFSTAIMSGAMALVTARYPALSPAQRIQRVLSTVDVLPGLSGKCVSGGRLNLARALGPPVIADFTRSPSSGPPPLTVQFTNTSFGAITQWSWEFGDGMTSTDQNPIHTFTSGGDFSVKLTVNDANGHVGTTQHDVVVVENYRIGTASFAWVDPSGMSVQSLSMNGVTPAIPLPFPFIFYGQPQTTIYMGANGLIGFDPASMNTPANTDLPSESTPNNILCPFWDALTPSAGTRFYTGVTGLAPNRHFVASWVGVNTTGPRTAALTFQCILEETSHRILFQYQDVAPTSKSASASGKTATVGIEDSTGSSAAWYSYNGSTLLTNGTALVFTPPAAKGNLSVVPTVDLASAGPVGGPFAPTSQNYTLTNSGTASLTWTGSVTQPWLTLSDTTGTLNPGQSTTVTMSINTTANGLAVGAYQAALMIGDTKASSGEFQSMIQVSVLKTPRISIEQDRALSQFEITVQGDPSQRYRLESSTDLVVWDSVEVGASDSTGRLVTRQPASEVTPRRFYRAVLILP